MSGAPRFGGTRLGSSASQSEDLLRIFFLEKLDFIQKLEQVNQTFLWISEIDKGLRLEK